MTLKEYLDKNFVIKCRFAKRAGISTKTLHNILNGLKIMPSTATKIRWATNDQVNVDNMISTNWKRKKDTNG